MHWNYKTEIIPEDLNDLTKLLLENRKIEDQELFFNPQDPTQISLHDLEIDETQVKKAIKLILSVLETRSSRLVVFGDYDADGICATAVMAQVLRDLGAKVETFIPHREKHGYGLSNAAIDDILAQGKPDLLITVDNGIVAHDEVQRLVDEGVKVIITDHHQTEEQLPNADAVVHSTKLCGATVAWILARELVLANQKEEKRNQKKLLVNQLDLCGVATIADQVKLEPANRSFAKFGIDALRKTKRPGLLALFKEAEIDQKLIDTYTINFQIAPRINAMGRLESGEEALELLISNDKGQITNLANRLNEVNTNRQDITYEAIDAAKAEFEAWESEHIIIVKSQSYHEGVIGLIAGKLVDEYYKPAIAISIGETQSKGSARSVSGVNITDLLRELKDDLLSVGGHPMAAGFSVASDKLEVFSEKLKVLAKEKIDLALLEKSLKLECKLPSDLLSEDLVSVVNQFAPFGPGNRKPVFAIESMQIVDVRQMGRDGKHLKLLVRQNISPAGGEHQVMQKQNLIREGIAALFWNHGHLATQLKPGDIVNLAAIVDINEWNGRRSVQLIIRDIEQSLQ